jgi:hypothetical protein
MDANLALVAISSLYVNEGLCLMFPRYGNVLTIGLAFSIGLSGACWLHFMISKLTDSKKTQLRKSAICTYTGFRLFLAGLWPLFLKIGIFALKTGINMVVNLI